MGCLPRLTRSLITLVLLFPSLLLAAVDGAGADWETLIAQGVALRQRGNLQQSVELLEQVQRSAGSPGLRASASGERGVSFVQAHRYAEGEAALREAYAYFSGYERARYAAYLGNLALQRRNALDAQRYYDEALALSGDDADIRLSVGLNRVRLAPENERQSMLLKLSGQLDSLPPAFDAARFHLNLGNLARQTGSTALPLAYRHLDRARKLSATANGKSSRLHAEALAALAQLYEDQNRPAEALTLNRQGRRAAQTLGPGESADLLIDLDWRAGRLLKAQGKPDAALAAWRRAVEQIESVRQDIPVDYEDGRSSFRATLQPIFLGYVDLLLAQQPASDEAKRAQLRSVVDTIELIRQSELQDFLGDRCAVEAVQGGLSGKVPAGTAVLYPLLLPDRLELLLETSAGIERRSSPVREANLRATATRFASLLRNGLEGYQLPARQLYNWLLRPLDDLLAAQEIRALVVVPDGALRLVPFAALDDGAYVAIEKYAVSMVTGLSMTNAAPAAGRQAVSLIAGISEPGDVVSKLDSTITAQLLEPNAAGGASADGTTRSVIHRGSLRAMQASQANQNAPGDARAIDKLKTRLALPGVKDEVQALAAILPATRLLNADFTVSRFNREAGSGDFRIVHIASHGVFGGSAETSFIMAHDDLLTMDGLQSLLRGEKVREHPIELLSLSACQTAEGNDRSPLGFSGAAIKARAKSVLGTLWPVDDDAARSIMEGVYGGLARGGLSKTEALRQAQLAMLGKHESAHPFFWAPFVLIGNWQ